MSPATASDYMERYENGELLAKCEPDVPDKLVDLVGAIETHEASGPVGEWQRQKLVEAVLGYVEFSEQQRWRRLVERQTSAGGDKANKQQQQQQQGALRRELTDEMRGLLRELEEQFAHLTGSDGGDLGYRKLANLCKVKRDQEERRGRIKDGGSAPRAEG